MPPMYMTSSLTHPDLITQPARVERTNIVPVEQHLPVDGIVQAGVREVRGGVAR